MNFRITALFFALLLTMLWVFGYMVQYKKAAGDVTLILPTLERPEVVINKVVIKRQAPDKDSKDALEALDVEFIQEFDRWYQTDGKQKVRIEGFRIKNLIDEVKRAKHDETADVNKDPSVYGLKTPRMTVTLSGKYKDDNKTWELSVGDERAGLVYVKTSDRDKVSAVSRRSIDGLFFKKAEYLRSKRLFDFVDTEVRSIYARVSDKEKKSESELELKRGEGTSWLFVKPAYGYASLAEPAEKKPEKEKDPFHKKPPPPPVQEKSSVSALLSSIIAVHVDDDDHFLPIGKSAADYGLDKGKETMRIEIRSGEDKKDKKDADKRTTETLLIGKKETVDKQDYYFARLDNDDGIMKISSKWLDPIVKAVEKPEKLRSLDVAAFDKDKVDVVTLKQGSTVTEFFKQDVKIEVKFPGMPDSGRQWQMIQGKEKKKASDAMLTTLLEQALGQKAIVEFAEGSVEDSKKKEAEWGLDPFAVEIAVYENGIDTGKKDEKKDEKKDAKKEEKKDEKKDDKLPTLKKDHKPEVILTIGTKVVKDKSANDVVYVRRELKDGSKSYFTVKKEMRDKVLPPEGIDLAYLDTSLPELSVPDVVSLKLVRVTDKGTKTVELSRRFSEGKAAWYLQDEPGTSPKLADSDKVIGLLHQFTAMPVKKWVRKTDELDKYGLKSPAVTVTLVVKKNAAGATVVSAKDKDGKDISINAGFAFIGLAAADALGAAAYAALLREHDKGETIVLDFGKESDDPKDKSTYARHSGLAYLYLTPTVSVKALKEIDLHDRSAALYTQPELDLMYLGGAASNPMTLLLLGSPHVSGLVHDFKPATVKEVRLMLRTPTEVRRFQFERKDKDKPKEPAKPKDEKAKTEKKDEKAKDEKAKDEKSKDEKAKDDPMDKYTWIDQTKGLDEFQLDPDKVTALVKDFARLHATRFASIMDGPRPEHKLTDKEATLKLELVLDDGKTTVTVLVGAEFQPHGYFATSTLWTRSDGKLSTVFFLPRNTIDMLLRGTEHFGKERSGAN